MAYCIITRYVYYYLLLLVDCSCKTASSYLAGRFGVRLDMLLSYKLNNNDSLQLIINQFNRVFASLHHCDILGGGMLGTTASGLRMSLGLLA